jgi:hypothetical protein
MGTDNNFPNGIPDIFLSHVGEDGDFVKELASKLEENQLLTWYYERDSNEGSSFNDQSIDIIESSKVSAFIISRSFLNRRDETWVEYEISYAISEHKPHIWIFKDITFEDLKQHKDLRYFIRHNVAFIGKDPKLADKVKNFITKIPPKKLPTFVEKVSDIIIIPTINHEVSNSIEKTKSHHRLHTEKEINFTKKSIERLSNESSRYKWFQVGLISVIAIILTLCLLVVFPISTGVTGIPISSYFIPTMYMDDTGDINLSSSYALKGDTAGEVIKIQYSAKKSHGKGTAGVYWLYPPGKVNMGTYPEGIVFDRYNTIIFKAKGENGGEIAIFKVGGVGGKYPDSIQPAISTESIILSNSWKSYSIPLAGKDLSHVIGGFCWVTNVEQNPKGCTIFIDDIYAVKNRTMQETLILIIQYLIGGLVIAIVVFVMMRLRLLQQI